MNIKDMELLIGMVKQVEGAKRAVRGLDQAKHIETVLMDALDRHKAQIITEFEVRHTVEVEV